MTAIRRTVHSANSPQKMTASERPQFVSIRHFEEGWKIINDNGISRLLSIINNGMKGKITNREFAIIYTTVYNMCLQKTPKSFAEELYEKFCITISDHLNNVCKPAIFSNDKHGEYMLIELVTQYRSYKFFVKWLIQTFSYLDRQYVKRFHKPSLKQVATEAFKEIIFKCVKSECIPVALELVERDRQNIGDIDRTVLRDFVLMFIDVAGGQTNIYKNDFELEYLNETTQYYLSKSRLLLYQMSCQDYLKMAENIINEEQERENAYLHHSTHSELLKRLYAVLLVQPQKQLLSENNNNDEKQNQSNSSNGGVYSMIANQNYAALERLYKLYSCVPHTLPYICNIVAKRFKDEGNIHLSKSYEQRNSREFVESLLNLYKHHSEMITSCFRNQADFARALKDGYSVIVNRGPLSMYKEYKQYSTITEDKKVICQLISQYCDLLMRKDGIRLLESELYSKFDEICKIFAYIHDKDLFFEFYRKQLAKRLLTQRSHSDYAEKYFITKLKLTAGALQFTSRLEGMIKDIERSMDYVSKFEKYHKKLKIEYDFIPKVLTSGFWPQFEKPKLLLPRSMKSTLDAFEKYYLKCHEKRKLTWIHELGIIEIIAHFDEKDIILQVSTLQACILLLLNSMPKIKIIDIKNILSVDSDDIKKQLKPLCSKSFPILIKEPKSGYNEQHHIIVNNKWNPNKKRFKIPSGSHLKNSNKKINESKNDNNNEGNDNNNNNNNNNNNESTNEARNDSSQLLNEIERNESEFAVMEARKYMYEASIVRIMKARQTLSHSDLVAQVSSQLMHRFEPNPKHIKQRIADLIEREYLQRDSEKNNFYHYIA